LPIFSRDEVTAETARMGQPVMDELLEDVNQRQYKTALVINDNFQAYIKSGDIKQPQPNEKMVKKIIGDIEYR
jgi:hypothetical protein